jgi:hypothetical protein
MTSTSKGVQLLTTGKTGVAEKLEILWKSQVIGLYHAAVKPSVKISLVRYPIQHGTGASATIS